MFKKLLSATILLLAFVLPLFFLPTTLNLFTTNKQALLGLTLAVLLFGFSTHLLTQKKLPLKKSPLLFPLILFDLALILNLSLIPTTKMEAIINRGSLYLLLSLLTYFIISLNLTQKTLKLFTHTLIATGTLLALHSIFQILLAPQVNFLPGWLKVQTFTPTGSILTTLIFLTLTLILTFKSALQQKNPLAKTLLFLITSFQLAAVVAYLTLIHQGSIKLFLLPLRAGWSVALDALKSPKNLLLGVGLANFTNFFTTAKPLFLNQTKFWNFLPSTSSTELLSLLTTTGLTGFLSFIFLLITGLKLSKDLPQTPTNSLLKTIFICLIIAFLILPADLILISLLFLVLGLIANQAPTSSQSQLKLPIHISYSLAFLSLILGLGLTYGTYRVYAAEYYMRQAQLALTRQDAKATYENHLKAIKLMPAIAAYHTSLSQIDLELASSISQKKNLSDEDKQQIASLIQQAIAEAKTAVQLQPNNSGLWQNLALIYRNLITTAKNANQFADQYYAQALKLDPANPYLHLRYGGLFYQLAQITKDKTQQQKLLAQALQQFQTAVQLKPDYANAYYNLAKTYELANNFQAAYQAMQQVLANLDQNSPDYNLAKEELKKLEEKLPKKKTSKPTQKTTKPKQLSQPSPLPSPLPTNKSINLEK